MMEITFFALCLFWICCFGMQEPSYEQSTGKESKLGDSLTNENLGISLNSSNNLGISIDEDEATITGTVNDTEENTCIYDFNCTCTTPQKEEKLDLGPLCSTPKGQNNGSECPVPAFLDLESSDTELCNTVTNNMDLEELEIVPVKSFTSKAAQRSVKTRLSHRKNDRMLERKSNSISLKLMNKQKCCPRKCFKLFDVPSVVSSRKFFWLRPFPERVEWFYDKAMDCQDVSSHPLWSSENGNRICSKAFRDIYGIQKNFFYKYLTKFKNGAVAAGKDRCQFPSSTYNRAMTWLQEFATDYGDRMPHTQDILLPYKTRKLSVWEKYSNEKAEAMESQLGCSTFQTMWKKHFPHLKIKKTNSFSKCTKCTSLERQLERTRDRQERKYLKQLLSQHNERQMNERKYYYRKRELSKQQPDRYLSMIIDGMDQSKTNIPHMIGRKAKTMSPVDMLQTHLTGVLCHGRNLFSNYLDLVDFKHDPNLIMNIVQRILFRLSRREHLPPVLFLQADNCFRENKNKFVLGFCELLVRLKIVSEVHLSFLYVGHTHEDIDAGFSRISETLKQSEAETLPELKAIIPDCHQLKGMYDIKSWLEPNINVICHHSKPLHFKFFVDSTLNSVKAAYKGSFDQPWISMDEPLLNGIPRGCPKFIYPNFDHINCDKMQKCVESWKILFSNEKVQSQWWHTFLSEIKVMQSNKKKLKVYSSADNIWLLSKIPKQPNIVETTESLEIIPEKLKLLLQRETDPPKVTTKKRKCRTELGKKKTKSNRNVKTISTTYQLVHIPYSVLEKIWYFVVLQALLNFIGHKSHLCGDKSFSKLWNRVLNKHIGKESKAKGFVSVK